MNKVASRKVSSQDLYRVMRTIEEGSNSRVYLKLKNDKKSLSTVGFETLHGGNTI